MNEQCAWTEDGEDSGTYDTSCGNRFSITDGTPSDNGFLFCCYCGKPLADDSQMEDAE